MDQRGTYIANLDHKNRQTQQQWEFIAHLQLFRNKKIEINEREINWLISVE